MHLQELLDVLQSVLNVLTKYVHKLFFENININIDESWGNDN